MTDPRITVTPAAVKAAAEVFGALVPGLGM